MTTIIVEIGIMLLETPAHIYINHLLKEEFFSLIVCILKNDLTKIVRLKSLLKIHIGTSLTK